jgi:hypothetical protein
MTRVMSGSITAGSPATFVERGVVDSPQGARVLIHDCRWKGKPMIYELRIYRSVPGRLPALVSRFQNHTLRIWERHGIRQAGFWTTLIGESNQQLTYMLAWNSMAEREERWDAFRADPEWIAISAESEKDGQLVQNIRNEVLAPTEFSSVK